ncbi:L-type lectin-domain containing receptor kinase SIT2-like [Miscanthus floridulus]|uniref:L-type lectin-domain containing receptor kinase SIT2-like n=1 Tax=Miscanthus floridulus TaxID=154761 RepID=UPI00345B460E
MGNESNHLLAIVTSGCYTSDGEFKSGEPMQVWVDYDSERTILNVTIAHLPSTKPNRPLLSIPYDLSSVLPNTRAYVGFSSAAGRIPTMHCILGWSFKLNGEAAALNYSDLPLKSIQQLRAGRHTYKTIIIVCAVLGIAMIVSATIVKVRMMNRLSKSRTTDIEWEREYGPPSFTYKDLLAATSGFNDKMLLGRGGFGSVFRGVLHHSKQTVAIKRVSPESKQGMKEFMAEILILGHPRHRNLVQLIGYCRHKQQLLLVYDYMPNGSLDSYLHTQDHSTTNICWAQRFCIIKGFASGLFYLHEDWEQVVIHRDIKTSNVLLDGEMNARLGDFGLARSHDHGADAHTTRVAGTWGYIAPELARLGKATKATDVFAFGVLMMEVACGRRPIWVDGANGEPVAISDWVLAAWRGGSITDAVDTRLDDYVEEEIELVLTKLGLLCSHPSPNARPCMRRVMQYLQRDAPLPADLQPDNLLRIGVSQELRMMSVERPMSCPATTITGLSKGR